MSVVVALIWPSFGLNLVADSLGLWFVTFVVDAAIEEQRRASQQPILRAALIDAEAILWTLARALRDALECAVLPADLPKLQGVPDPAFIGEVLHRFGFDQRTSYVHPLGPGAFQHRTWADVLMQVHADLAQKVQQFIPRYATVADASLTATIKSLEGSSVLGLTAVFQTLGNNQTTDAAPWAELVQFDHKLRSELAVLRAEIGMVPRAENVALVDNAFIEQLQAGALPKTYPSETQQIPA